MHTEIYTTTILVATFLTAASFALALPFENDGKNPEGLVTWKAVVANHQEGDAGWSADLVERMRSEGVEERDIERTLNPGRTMASIFRPTVLMKSQSPHLQQTLTSTSAALSSAFEKVPGFGRDHKPSPSSPNAVGELERDVEKEAEPGRWICGWTWLDELLDWFYPRNGAVSWRAGNATGPKQEDDEEIEEVYVVSGRMGDLKLRKLGRRETG